MRRLDGINDSVDMNRKQTPGESEGPMTLKGYSPRGHKELNTT